MRPGGFGVDKKDLKILQILRADARTPFVDVARRIGMTEGAIRARVKRLTRDGTIERFTIVARSEGIRAVVAVKTKSGASSARVAAAVRKVPDVSSVFEVTGDVDLLAFIDAGDTRALNRAIERIRKNGWVVGTESMTILDEH